MNFLINKLINTLGNTKSRCWIPFLRMTYLPRKGEIRMNKKDFMMLLDDWDLYSNEQKATQRRIMEYHFKD